MNHKDLQMFFRYWKKGGVVNGYDRIWEKTSKHPLGGFGVVVPI